MLQNILKREFPLLKLTNGYTTSQQKKEQFQLRLDMKDFQRVCALRLIIRYADSSRMFCIGDVGEEKARLVRVAKECVEKGLEQVKAWGFLGDMSQAVHEHAVKNGYSVVREIGGHGVGLEFHEDPWVGYIGAAGTGMVMAPGLMFTIEPMVNMGTDEIFVDERDGWTIYTEDDMPSAQWEIMVLVTENGPEVIAW